MTAGLAPTKTTGNLVTSLMAAELRVFLRQPVMIALTLLLPVTLVGITAMTGSAESPQIWAQTVGQHLVATQCITVYFVALNTVTARRHTLALKRLRTTALPGLGIVLGLLTPPVAVGAFQVLAVLGGLMALGAPTPQSPALLLLTSVLGIMIAALAGVATSGFTATPEKAQWTMLPLFVAAMGATAILPTVASEVGSIGLRLIPLVANAHMATEGWYSPDSVVAGAVVDVVIMIGWVIALSMISWRTFRWERR